ncbi:hypothetical protein QVD17_20602 [Tagetes erecta]|uniref:Uncharacterized protein n=1 Tax=Tagetes erecta TaxID=13708 RepID=A0AAD8NYA0_TARER|nr:hypothetical protein QVD17_20602 [Tagetes erecta]
MQASYAHLKVSLRRWEWQPRNPTSINEFLPRQHLVPLGVDLAASGSSFTTSPSRFSSSRGLHLVHKHTTTTPRLSLATSTLCSLKRPLMVQP